MAPKKNSAFMMYVTEFRKKPQGQRMTISQAVTHCGSIWKNMNDQQRGPFISAAKNEDVASRARPREVLNCHGEPVAFREKEDQEAANEIERMKRDIDRMVREARKCHDLENTKFIFVSFNYFAKGLNTDLYIPAEFAACEFSLKRGVNSLYSTMIDPSHLIFGQTCEAMLHATATHQLPLPPSALGESNMTKLYQSIQDYLRGRLKRADKKLKSLLVFTKTDDITMVKSCFRFIQTGYENEQRKRDDDDDDDDEDAYFQATPSKFLPIVVYDLQYLFLALKLAAMEIGELTVPKPNLYITDAFFSRDYYEFQDGIGCHFHEDIDRSKHCTQSRVNRWVYTFCDYICADMAIQMKPGKHMPPTYHSAATLVKFESDASVDSFFSLTTASALTLKQENKDEASPTPSTISTAGSRTPVNTIPVLEASSTGNKSRDKKMDHLNPWNTNDQRTLKTCTGNRVERKYANFLEEHLALADINDEDFDLSFEREYDLT